MMETLQRTLQRWINERADDAATWFDGFSYDDIFRAPPFLLAAVYLTVFVALTIVQALVARQEGADRWWDWLTVSMVGFFAGWAFYSGALGGNYAGWGQPSLDYFTVNRVWIGASAIVGLPIAILALWRGVHKLIGLLRHQPTHNRVTFDLPPGVKPDVRVESIRPGDPPDKETTT